MVVIAYVQRYIGLYRSPYSQYPIESLRCSMGKLAGGPTSEPGWITAQDVVDRLLSTKRLKRLASTCVLPAVRRDGQWMFRRNDLEAWIREQSQTNWIE